MGQKHRIAAKKRIGKTRKERSLAMSRIRKEAWGKLSLEERSRIMRERRRKGQVKINKNK